jgi:sugar lactone lactonase YvrE
MRRFDARPVSDEHHVLAEGPLWDPIRERLLWVDIEAAEVLGGEYRGGEVLRSEVHRFEGTVGAVVPAVDGRLLVAGHRGLVVVDPAGEVLDTLPVVPDGQESRLNDGGCDPAGRFLIGTMALDDREGAERLCRLESDGRLTILDADLTLSNGLAWSPDGSRFYSVDSEPGTIWVRDYDVASGEVGDRTRLVAVEDGTPDGMCSDTDGNLWVAMFGSGEVRCYSPTGEQLAVVDVGVPNPTSVAFVGPDLDRLLITTARHELSDDELAANPDAGRLFLADVAASGVPVALWNGAWTARIDSEPD